MICRQGFAAKIDILLRIQVGSTSLETEKILIINIYPPIKGKMKMWFLKLSPKYGNQCRV